MASFSMRVSKLDELLTLIVSNIKNSIRMTLNDTFLVNSTITLIVLRRTGTHQGLDFVEVSQLRCKKLEIVFVCLQSQWLRESVLNQVR